MASYLSTQPLRHPRIVDRETPEARFWKKFRQPFYQRLPAYPSGLVSDVSFCPQAPYNFAVTCSTRVHIFSCRLNREATRLSRFGGSVFSGRLRPTDGALLAAGTGGTDNRRKALVRVFQMQLDRLGNISGGNKPLLREFQGHTGDITVVRWSKSGLQVLSGSDDRTARLWNLAHGTDSMIKLEGHNDYVRCAEQWSGVGSGGGAGGNGTDGHSTWVTGCYDHVCRLWDVRAGGEACSLSMDHGAPVSALLPLPGSALMLSCGSNYCRVWDVMSGGKMLCEWSAHQKGITDVCLDGTGTRILTAGLDGHVKIHDATGASNSMNAHSPLAFRDFEPGQPSVAFAGKDVKGSAGAYALVHGLKFEKPVMSVALAPDNSRLVVGLSDGTVVVRKRSTDLAHSVGGAKRSRGKLIDPYTNPTEAMRAQLAERRATLKASSQSVVSGGTFRFFTRGKDAKPQKDDFQAAHTRKAKLQPYDRLLKEFSYRAALDAGLATRQPGVVAALLEEMIARGALDVGLGGRDDVSLEPLMAFLIKYVSKPRFSKLLVRVCERVLSLYSPVLGRSPVIDDLIYRLNAKIKEELQLQMRLLKLNGSLGLILSSVSK